MTPRTRLSRRNPSSEQMQQDILDHFKHLIDDHGTVDSFNDPSTNLLHQAATRGTYVAALRYAQDSYDGAYSQVALLHGEVELASNQVAATNGFVNPLASVPRLKYWPLEQEDWLAKASPEMLQVGIRNTVQRRKIVEGVLSEWEQALNGDAESSVDSLSESDQAESSAALLSLDTEWVSSGSKASEHTRLSEEVPPSTMSPIPKRQTRSTAKQESSTHHRAVTPTAEIASPATTSRRNQSTVTRQIGVDPIPQATMDFANVIKSLPRNSKRMPEGFAAGRGFPSRNALKSHPSLLGQITKNKGALIQTKRGGKLMEWDGDGRLFGAEWWDFLMMRGKFKCGGVDGGDDEE